MATASTLTGAAVAAVREAPAVVRSFVEDARSQGEGRLTWFGLHVYDARLYVPGRGIDGPIPGTQPFALEIVYARALSGSAIAERSREEIDHLGLGSVEQRERWLKQMRALFPDVTAGQRLTGIYTPDAATRFFLDDRALGSIDDPAFGRAFFSIWLDPRTREPRLRARLLGQAG